MTAATHHRLHRREQTLTDTQRVMEGGSAVSGRMKEGDRALLRGALCAVAPTMLQSRSWASSEGGVEGRCLDSTEGTVKEEVDGEASIVEDASEDGFTAGELEEAWLLREEALMIMTM